MFAHLLAVIPLMVALLPSTNLGAETNHSFDIFILTQHWPVTTCVDWQNRDQNNKCNMTDVPAWSLHGLWPTQFGKIAPTFCNNQWKFNESEIEGIMANMSIYWPDVEIRDTKDSLWSHEWSKHGTCAAELPQFDSELKYFSTGLQLAMENPITLWFNQKNMAPGNEYTKENFWDTILENTNTRPHIDCEHISGKQYIKEIKICFKKDLTPTHCDGIVQSSGVVGKMQGNCKEDEMILYPGSGSSTGMVWGIVCMLMAAVAIVTAVILGIRRMKRTRQGYVSI